MKLLIAEEDQAAAETWAQALRKLGHEVELSSDGRAAARRLRAEAFDLCLADVVLSGYGAAALAISCKKAAPQTRFVAMTGVASMRGAVPGCAAILVKPFDADRLKEVVEQFEAVS